MEQVETKVGVPALYPHRTLDQESARDPEQVLRWAGTWLSGEAAHHADTLRAAADIVAAREAAIAELMDAARGSLNACPGASQVNADVRLMTALARVGGGK